MAQGSKYGHIPEVGLRQLRKELPEGGVKSDLPRLVHLHERGQGGQDLGQGGQVVEVGQGDLPVRAVGVLAVGLVEYHLPVSGDQHLGPGKHKGIQAMLYQGIHHGKPFGIQSHPLRDTVPKPLQGFRILPATLRESWVGCDREPSL